MIFCTVLLLYCFHPILNVCSLVTGSVGHVHLTCLEKWLNECGDDKCELCLFRFQAERTRRYTALRSMIIWARHPTHRHILYSDLSVMIILTTVVIFLITCLTVGMRQFRTLDPR